MEHLGLVGLAGSGHAALFGALTGLDASAASDRLVGVVRLADDRLDRLAAMSRSRQVVPATFELAYLPALSAEAGHGLGSRLLGSLRDADAVCVVVRAAGGGDPAGELASIEEELILADLGSVEQRRDRRRRDLKGDRSLAAEVDALERAAEVLADGIPLSRSGLHAGEHALLDPAFLLTNKPSLVVVAIDEEQLASGDDLAAPFGEGAIAACIEVEAEIAACTPEDRPEMLKGFGITESVLPRLARGVPPARPAHVLHHR